MLTLIVGGRASLRVNLGLTRRDRRQRVSVGCQHQFWNQHPAQGFSGVEGPPHQGSKCGGDSWGNSIPLADHGRSAGSGLKVCHGRLYFVTRRTARTPRRLSRGVRQAPHRDAAAQARRQMGISQIRRRSARRQATTPPLLHTEAEGHRGEGHLNAAHLRGVQGGGEAA